MTMVDGLADFNNPLSTLYIINTTEFDIVIRPGQPMSHVGLQFLFI